MNAVVILIATINAALSLRHSNHYVFVGPQDTQLKTYDQAQAYCQENFDSNLATIGSYADQAEAAAFVVDHFDAWIGYNNLNPTKKFKWIDGTPSRYGKWYVGEPNRMPGEHCVHMGRNLNGRWNDAVCTRKMAFICNSLVIQLIN